jgi:hypothetical protein
MMLVPECLVVWAAWVVCIKPICSKEKRSPDGLLFIIADK